MNSQRRRELAKLVEVCADASRVYKLGRQHQRDSDSELCKSMRVYERIPSGEKYLSPYRFDGERHEGVLFSEAILKNEEV